jgi:hypothetical protein
VLEREHNDLVARRSALEQKLAQAPDALREALAARLPAMAADFVLRVRQLISELPLALYEFVREVQNLATRTAGGQEPLCRPTPPVPEPPPAPVIDRMRCMPLLRYACVRRIKPYGLRATAGPDRRGSSPSAQSRPVSSVCRGPHVLSRWSPDLVSRRFPFLY